MKKNHVKNNLTMLNWILISIIFSSFWILLHGYRSPCPNVLSYRYDGQQWTGQIIVVPNPEHQVFNLSVKITTNVSLSWSNIGSIEVMGSYLEVLAALTQGSHLIYKLNLPYTILLSQITKIVFNEIILCEIRTTAGYNTREIILYHTLKKYSSYDSQVVKDSVSYFHDEELNTVLHPQYTTEIQPSLSTVDLSRLSQENNFKTDSVTPISPPITIPSTKTTSKSVYTISTTEQNVYSQENINGICGTTAVTLPLISKGSEAIRGEFPWLVALFRSSFVQLSFRCAGSLISSQHVVTAAHCIKLGNMLIPKDELLVFLGKYNLWQWKEPTHITVPAKDIHIHPEYSGYSANFVADIAIITLEEKVTFTPVIRPICLWEGSVDLAFVEGFNGTIVGWGKDEDKEKLQPIPRKVQLPIVSHLKCFLENKHFARFTSNYTFCAGRRDGAGPCSGDSGSGFLLVQNKRWVLRGIVSVSLEDTKTYTCDLYQYFIFTDVAKFRNWITNITGNI